MAEKIKIDLEVIDNLETSIGNLKQLKRQLKEVEAGTETFDKIKQKIYDMEDAIKSANTGASNFAEIVGGLPGPVGELGDKVSNSVNVLKQFGGIKLDALKNSFSELGKDVSDGVKGFGQLTGITKLYESSVSGLTKAMTFLGVAENTAAVAARGLSAALIASGIGALIVLIGQLIANWDTLVDKITGATGVTKAFAQSTEASAKAVSDFNTKLYEVKATLEAAKKGTISKKDALKEYNEKLGETVGYAGSLEQAEKLMADNTAKVVQAIGLRAQAQSLYAIAAQKSSEASTAQEVGFFSFKRGLFQSYSNELKDRKKQLQEDSKNIVNEADKLLTQALELEKTKTKGLATKPEDKKAATGETPAQKLAREEKEQIKKIQEEANLDLLTAKQREEEVLKQTYEKNLALLKKYNKDTTNLTKAYEIEKNAITDKYNKIESDKAKQKANEDKAARKEEFDKNKAELDLQRAQKLIDEDTYQTNLEALKIKYAETEVERINAQIEHLNYLDNKKKEALEKDKERAKEQEEINKQIALSWIDLGNNIAGTFQQLGQLFEGGSDMAKTFGVISVLINAAAAIGKINMDFNEAISSKKKTIAMAADAVSQGTAMLPLNPFVGSALIAAGTASGTAAKTGLAILRGNKYAQIASVGLASGAQIAAILSEKKSGGAMVAASGGHGGEAAGGEGPSYSGAAPTLSTPQFNTQPSATPGAQIASTLAMTSGKPIRAYVVSSDISSQQSLDRKVNRGATFSMGS